ncbi:hypothetical protein V6N13_094268 [Hibiscus sabdariffa]|uniref:DUF4228 domain-containing protein n=1 Tax=Hibiscus sabdariffa TaxID=183260 RepID=A0ABR2PQA1_9ROSI
MGISLRCCLACVLPCGALDLIRIVHLNGQVQEITPPVTAADILHAYPNHFLSKPSSQGLARISPHSQLKRGAIYFLIPASSLPTHDNKNISPKQSFSNSKNCGHNDPDHRSLPNLSISDLKRSGRCRRNHRNSRERVWQPHLASISED